MRLEAVLGRIAALILPRPFRERFGVEFSGAIEALARAARDGGGARHRLLYLLRELTGLVRLSVSLRRASHAGAGPRQSGASMASILVDQLRSVLRHARRRPALAAAASGTIALSIAAATTAVGLANAVLWRDLPFAHASRLVFVWEEIDRDGESTAARVTGARHASWRDAGAPFDSMSLFGAAGFTVDYQGIASSIRGVRVSANYFDTLGIQPVLGRAFVGADATPGNHRVVVLSHALWRERFGGRLDVVGETWRLSGEAYTVIGVMPAVTFPAWPVNPAAVTLDAEFRQLWVPIPWSPGLDQAARAHVFGVVARLAPGVSGAEAADRLNATADPAAPDPHRARVAPFREQLVAGARAPLLALAGAALAILLIACTNLAALFLSAFESRRAEMSVRMAIGATASRLAIQLGLEALVLASAGAACGILLAAAALGVVPKFLPPSIPLLTPLAVDLGLAAFACALAAGAGVMLAGWPIVRMIMAAPSPRAAARPRALVYRVLVVSQLAVTMALVAAAGLLARTLWSVERQHPGFAVDRVLVADIGLPVDMPPDGTRIAQAEQDLLAAVAARPGVRAAAAAYDHPLEANWSETPVIVGDDTSAEQRQAVELRIVSPGYFEALNVELLDGRTLTGRDTLGMPGVVIVNEALAQRIGGQVLGRRIRSGTPRVTYPSAPVEFEIVGIVSNERFRGLEQDAQPACYLSSRQFPQSAFSLLARTDADPLPVVPDLRAAVRDTNPAITVDRATSLDRILSEQLLPRRVTTDIVGGFAIAALALAALGLYGLLAVLIGSRTREIGVRLAIGASPASIARDVLGYGLWTAALGILAGCAVAAVTGRLLQGLLVDLAPQDPATLTVVATVLLGIALCASAVPAWRAARIDPVTALRPE